jgi:hypothetical protein
MNRGRSGTGGRFGRWSARGCLSILVAIALTACGSNADSSRTTPSPSIGEDTAFVTVWLAVLRIAADSNDLDADTQELLATVPSALVVAPLVCFKGLPEDVAGQDAYVLGLESESMAELDRVVAETGREPLFVVRVRDFCID